MPTEKGLRSTHAKLNDNHFSKWLNDTNNIHVKGRQQDLLHREHLRLETFPSPHVKRTKIDLGKTTFLKNKELMCARPAKQYND